MTKETKLGLGVLEAALLLGLLGDLLLRAQPLGVNVFLWVGALAAACVALARQRRATLGGEGSWLLPSVLAFAAAFAWRDSATLKFLDALAVLVLLALFALRTRGGRMRLAGLTDYVVAGLVTGVSALFGGLLLLFNDIGWKEIPRDGWSRHAWAVMRGLAIGVPLLLVFGALFAAADAVYEGILRRTFNFDADIAASHVLLFLALAWLSAGFLRTTFMGPTTATTKGGDLPAHVALGFTDAERPEVKERVASSAATNGASDFNAESVTLDVKGEGATAAGESEAKDDELMSAPPSVTEDVPPTTSSVTTRDETSSQTGTPPPADSAPTAIPSSTTGAPSSTADDASPSTSTADASPPSTSTVNAPPSSTTTGAPSSPPPPASAPPATRLSGAQARGVSLGVVEVGVVLGLLNALFLSFVVVQLRYFFGGSQVVLGSAGMTYAEYARRGFFELVWVAALVLPLLLGAHWMLRKDNPAHERVFRVLSGGLLLLLFVIMASAVGRMRLYQSEYGQTELRFYVTAFMGWLAVVFVWFALTVLRGERERFACGALVAAVAILGALHFVNPNALIVRTNAALARERRAFDAPYASSLGADAVPALLEALPEMRPHERAHIASNLLVEAAAEGPDWRSWNWSRSRARSAVVASESMLREWAKQLPPPTPPAAPPAAPLPQAVAEQPAVGATQQTGVRPVGVERQTVNAGPKTASGARRAKDAKRRKASGVRP